MLNYHRADELFPEKRPDDIADAVLASTDMDSEYRQLTADLQALDGVDIDELQLWLAAVKHKTQ
jgi:ribosomal protein L12E/L44/L45/RPP1/RPP2